MLPNFIGIGAQRAGTTWLHRCLSEHPQVFVPHPKEVHFFNRQFERGQAWYEERFAGAEGRIAVGEITPNYLNSPAAIPRMASVIPDARLLVVLREPVARAYSAYCLYHKQYNGLSFRQACESGRSLVELGLYAEQLQRVFNHYRREQVKVLLYEDIQVRPAQALADVFRFLGVDPGFAPPSTHKRYNRIIYPAAQQVLRRAGVTWAIDLIKRTRVGDWVKRAHARAGRSAVVNGHEADVIYLKSVFRDDVLRLQQLIDRDLSAWL